MAQLIVLKQHIKTIEMFRKTTNAMRLISMSHHTRTRQYKAAFDVFYQEVERLYGTVGLVDTHAKNLHSPRYIFVVGSHKGVCGTFNTLLLQYVRKNLDSINTTNRAVLSVFGHQCVELIKEQNLAAQTMVGALSLSTLQSSMRIIVDAYETLQEDEYIVIYSNYPKSFFVQKQRTTVLIKKTIFASKQQQVIHKMYLEAQIQKVLLDSLAAEFSARFVSMDTSTQNAEKIIAQLKLDYNKLRQASITKELIDLTATLVGLPD
ncbi:MAG: ATP synthase gamma chain [candidate division TM6 bacterium GW2011_GWE2_41_16]|nr:MAG: ATP synthase gamma chain [candidate division TM6 bacterium GW2011_GWE2_41_16]